ncbi:DUF2202 domain-containing protein [Sphingopyxis sp.]|uniref:ferritin-like domain-containing protein n=1 Tax=Sphingopyxis sp. TaxID=1908224 RepID=UPI001D4A268A|nr:DUF2202 domain-containing protein [Sphingopyxis sp.]MBW8295728.1 DUF2202 domain-containing protein [Sphingopyxis sp.]
MEDTELQRLLVDALDDERKAEATYATVIDEFGPVRPFTNIIEAEGRHSLAIERQMVRLGFPIPVNRWEGRGEVPAALAQACEMAIPAEIENIALYDRLIPRVGDPSVRQVLENLQAASRHNHLPAFRRCLAREGRGGGRGSAESRQGGTRRRGRCRA